MQLAESTGLSLSQINRIRNGTTRRPHTSTLRRLAEQLNTTVEWLRYGASTQFDAFDVSIPTREEAEAVDPVGMVRSLLGSLQKYPRELQIAACREAVVAILREIAATGELLPEAYQTLVFLDGIGMAARKRKPLVIRGVR